MKLKNKKLLIIPLIIFIILGLVGITNLITYAQNTDENGIQIIDNSIKVHFSFDKSEYEYIVGDNISIRPEITTEGLINEGEHPDKICYQWYKIGGGRPYPIEMIEGQTTDKLSIEKAALTDSNRYHLEVYIQRYNDEKNDYEEIKEGQSRKIFFSKPIDIKVCPEINIDLKRSDGRIQGSKSGGYSLELGIGEKYKLNLDLYRHEVIGGVETENKVPPEQVIKVTWESSNSNAVSVDDSGYLTATGFSESPITITATVTDINKQTKNVSIAVAVKRIPVESIKINGENEEDIEEISLEVGDKTKLTATVTPEYASSPEVTWTLKEGSSTDVASITASGELTGIKIGDTIVVATADEKSKECNVKVVETPVTEITDGLSSTDISLWENAEGTTSDQHSLTIHPEVLPENATNKTISWRSSDDTVARVEEHGDGRVSFIAGKYQEGNNTCTITATAHNEVKREYHITVKDHFISVDIEGGVTVEPVGTKADPLTLTVGDTRAFDFKVSPQDATYGNETWTVTNASELGTTDIISVDESGVVTANKEGDAYVKVSIDCPDPACPTHVGKSYIKVQPAPTITVESVEIENGDRITLRKNSTTTLTAKVTPAEAQNNAVTWESLNTSIATIDKTTGKVKGIAPGEATIRATAGGKSDTCVVEVTPIKVEYLEISDIELTVKDNLTIGDKKLTVSYYPEDADNKKVVWTSDDPTIVEIKEDGSIVPKKQGTTTVTATVANDPNVYATCEITVVPSKTPVVVYTVDQHTDFISGITLKLTGEDDEGHTIAEKEVTANGKFDFGELPDGSYVIHTILPTSNPIANANDLNILKYIEICNFKIIDGTLLYESPSDSEYRYADSLVLVNIVDYPDEEGEEDKEATVGIGEDYTKDGKTILEQYEEYNKVDVTSITDELSDTNISLVENRDEIKNLFTIHPEVLPQDATDKKLTWTSTDNSVAKAVENNNGTVSFISGAYQEGNNKCTITATAHNGIKRDYHITVVKAAVPVKDIIIMAGEELTPVDTIKLHVGESIHLSFKVEPEDATYTDDSWSFEPKVGSPADVISIDSAGLVTAKEIGEAEITVTVKCQSSTCPEHKKTISVQVIPVAVEKVEIELNEVEGQKRVTLNKHDTMTLTAKVTPENATDKTIKWDSSNPEIVSVDQNGNIEALAKGEVTITATAGDKTDTCKVTVLPIKIKVLKISDATLTLKENEEKLLTVSYLPEDADNAEFIWKTSNPSIAEVKGDGTVVAKGVGKAIVTVAVKDDDTVTPAICEVTVISSTSSDDPQNKPDDSNNGNTLGPNDSDNGNTSNPNDTENGNTLVPDDKNDGDDLKPDVPNQSKPGTEDGLPLTSDIPIARYIVAMIGSCIAILLIIFNKNKKQKRSK